MTPSLPIVEITNVARELEAIDRDRRARREEVAALLSRAEATLARAEALNVARLKTASSLTMASLLSDAGRFEDALGVLERLEPQLGGLVDQRIGIRFGGERVRALAALARAADPARARVLWEAVLPPAAKVASVVDRHVSGVAPVAMLSAFAGAFVDIYGAMAEAHLALGDAAAALAALERVKCRSAIRLAGASREEAPDEEELRRLTRELDQAMREGQPVDALLERRREKADLVAIARLVENAKSPRFDAAALRARLPPELAVVSWFWLDRQRLLVAALDRGALVTAVETFTPEERRAIDDKARSILELRGVPSWRGAVELDEAPFDRLLPPAVRAACEGKTRLVLSPHRSLHALPLHLLPWTDGRWLMRSFAISYAPNLTILMAPPAAPDRARPVLFVGVPARTFPPPMPLDGIEREERRVRKLHDPSRYASLMPPSGTKDELLALSRSGELARYGVLHFACHGKNGHPDSPMESRLMLHDADLDGLDVSSLRIEADLVVLSACHSGQRPVFGRGLDELPGDDLFGLQAAFFAAGARQLLGTLWPVRDGVAPRLSEDLHRELARAPADVALQRALAALLDGDPALHRTPPAWASFFLTTVGLPAASDAIGPRAPAADRPSAPLFGLELAVDDAADRGPIEGRLRERLEGAESVGASSILGRARAADPDAARALAAAVLVRDGEEPLDTLRELVAALRALSAEVGGVTDARIHAGARELSLAELEALDPASLADFAHAARH